MSEWGRLNAGQDYQVLALDVLRALAHAGLNRYEWIVMQVVIEQSWYTSARRKEREGDWPDPVPCKLNLADLARDIAGRDASRGELKALQNRLSEAKGNLIRSRLIVQDADGLWPQKDPELWTLADGVTPRLSPGSIAYAMAARTRKPSTEIRGNRPRKTVDAIHEIPGMPSTEIRGAIHEIPGKDPRKSVDSPIEARARVLDLDPTGLDQEEKTTRGSSAPTAASNGTPDGRPARPVVNDPSQVARVAAWAEDIPGPNGVRSMEELGSKVHQFETSYPIEWIEQAILRAVAAAKPGGVWRYAHQCLLRWWQAGMPDLAAEESARRAALAPKPAPTPKPLPIPDDPKYFRHLQPDGGKDRHAR